MKAFLKELGITLGLALVIFLIMQTTIQSSIVVGSSMNPGLENGQRLIVNKAVYHFKHPERGEVVIFQAPTNYQQDYIKRVIGLPGDTVQVKANDGVYVNGVKLDEPYISSQPRYNYGPFTVPSDNYFVLGDNRNNSNDSHTGWTVPSGSLVGQAWLSIWPFSDWGIVKSYPLAK